MAFRDMLRVVVAVSAAAAAPVAIAVTVARSVAVDGPAPSARWCCRLFCFFWCWWR